MVEPPDDPEAMDTTEAAISRFDRREAAYGFPRRGNRGSAGVSG
jgi:hypothetical protein